MLRLLVVLFSILFGLAAMPAQADASKETAAAAAIPLRGTLYRVDHENRTAWLFGTVHVGQPAFYPLEPQVMQALHQADALVVETDIRDLAALQQAIAQHALYPGGDGNIARHLPSADLAQLKQALAQAGIPFANVQRMKPWMVANLLIVHAMARAGFPPEQGLEQHFLQIAASERKAVHELEDAAYALSLFDGMPPAQQQAYLRETLRELQDGSGVAKGIAMIQAWRHADGAQLDQLYRAMLTDDSVGARFTQEALLERRNPQMTDGIVKLLQDEHRLFVAVGALHLIGEGSIPALLAQRGYRVTRLY
ncbi:TraB/GumN family protein [Oxalicibacterium flavum]|uniref:TraB/GumN family protein n=1 Tax=Oxalicibacterium flavum TaxID=179467 RepID=A0A8J2XV12_9BURK|nr:TraB/GumN family protein [Oxalicibacterium flavum]GGC06408.1 TraB/GumN family protein [Oxalicibacterium flavum]